LNCSVISAFDAFLYADEFEADIAEMKANNLIKRDWLPMSPQRLATLTGLRMSSLYVLVLTWEQKLRFFSLEGGLFLIFLTTIQKERWANRRPFPEVRLNALNGS
jgi:hypothetical protein